MRPTILRLLAGSAAMAGGVLAAPAALAQSCDTAGLDLPDGFCATEFATDANQPRHLAVADNGTVYVNLASEGDDGGLMALRDSNDDGKADERATFGKGGGTGLAIHDGWLYAATVTDIYRYRLGDSLTPEGEPEHLVTGMPEQDSHAARGLAVGDDDMIYVNNGAPSNACQEEDRSPGSKGQDPCPLLDNHGGIWQFSATETGQQFQPETEYATGLRNMFALDWHDGQLYGAQHGRDQLYSNWPDTFTQKRSSSISSSSIRHAG